MITSWGLQKLGFKSGVDFLLRDDGDGIVYISEWKSSSSQPNLQEIESAEVQWHSDIASENLANENNIASAKTKLEGLGLTLDEVKSAFGI